MSKQLALYLNPVDDKDIIDYIAAQRQGLEAWQDCARRLLREAKNRDSAKKPPAIQSAAIKSS